MISTALLTIGRILVMGLGSMQPNVFTPVSSVVPAIVDAARAAMPAAQSAVRSFSLDVFPQQSVTVQSDTGGASVELTPEEAQLLAQTNNERLAEGLSELRPDAMLCVVARQHSQDMADRNYFDHIAPSPGPVSPMDRYLAALGYRPDYAFLGENIYFRSATDSPSGSATQANTAFMRSPEHRANILQPRFTKIGVGFYRDPSTGAFWVTEMFLRDAE